MSEIYIFSQDDDLLTVISESTGLVSAQFRDKKNSVSDEPFVFTVEADVERAKHVKEENRVVFKDKDGYFREMVIKELDDIDNDDGPQTQATCIPAWLDELSENYVLDKRYTDKEAQLALNDALAGTRYIGEVRVSLGLASTNFYRLSSIDCIWEILKVWGGEFRDTVEFVGNKITVRKIIIDQRLGADKGARFEIDHNVEEIQRTVLSYPKTAMFGWGASLEIEDDEGNHTGGYTRYIDFADVEWSKAKGDTVEKPLGQKWVGDPDALLQYGRKHNGQLLHRYGEFSNQDYEDPAELLWATWQQLQEEKNPEVNYRLAVHLIDKDVSLGDTARAIDRQFARPIEIQTRVIAIEYDLLDIEGTAVVEMGQFLSAYDNDVYREIDDLKEALNKPRPTKPIDDGSFPDIKPGTPINVTVTGAFQTVQLFWDYDSNVYISHYEVYGSQVKDFVPDSQHLLWRGRTSAFVHEVSTDQVWYYRVRAVNTRGTPGDYSVQVSAATVRIISDDILFGSVLADHLSNNLDIAEKLAQNTIDRINEGPMQAIQYTQAEIEAAESRLLGQLNTQIGDVNASINDLLTRTSGIEGTVTNITQEVDDIEGRLSTTITQLSNIDGVVSDHTTTLQQHYNMISAKAEKSEVYTRTQTDALLGDKVNTTVYNNKMTSLDISVDGLNARATNAEAEINSLNGDMTNANSKIAELEITAGEISLNVWEIATNLTALDARTGNLITNPTLTGALGDWTRTAGTLSLNIQEFGENMASVMKGTHTANQILYSEWFEVDPAKAYEVTMWVRKSAAMGRIYIGLHGNDGITPNISNVGFRRVSMYGNVVLENDRNFYFWYPPAGQSPTDWVRITGYIMPAGTAPTDMVDLGCLPGGTKHNAIMLPNMRQIRVRVLNYDNTTSQDLFIANPKVVEIAGDVVSRVTASNAEIKVLSDEVSLKASQTSVNSLSGELSALQSEVNLIPGEIHLSVTEGIAGLEIGGRNLIILGAVTRGRYLLHSADGALGASPSHATTDFIEAFPSTDYVFSGANLGVQQVRFVSYDANKNYLSGELFSGDRGKFQQYKTPANAKFIRVSADYVTKDPVELWKLEKGNKATDWTPAPEDQVDKTNVLASINLSSEGVRIAGNKIHLTGQTLIDDGIIGTAAIANLAVTRGKIASAAIGTAQIEDAAITNAKIHSLNADKLTAGAIRGIDIYGAKFRSSAGTDYMEIVGGEIDLRLNNGRYMHLSPTGLYGYNAGGSVRFQADSLLVTSAALGTSNANVYLASINETRIVHYNSIPGDGNVDSYTYLPIRAETFRFPRVPYGYFTLLDGGEFRFIGEDRVNRVYQNVRANGYFGNFIEARVAADNLYLRADNRIRTTKSGTTGTYIDLQTNEILAHSIRVNSETTGSNFYIGASDGELRVTSNSLWGGSHAATIYRPVRASGFFGAYFDQHSGVGGEHIYIRPTSSGEVRVTVSGSTTTYRPMRASSFPTSTSLRENKTDIEVFNEDVLLTIRNASPYLYRVKGGAYTEQKQLGLMVDETPRILHGEAGDSMEMYALGTFLWAGLKQHLKVTDDIKDDVEWLKVENQFLKQKIKLLEDKVA